MVEEATSSSRNSWNRPTGKRVRNITAARNVFTWRRATPKKPASFIGGFLAGNCARDIGGIECRHLAKHFCGCFQDRHGQSGAGSFAKSHFEVKQWLDTERPQSFAVCLFIRAMAKETDSTRSRIDLKSSCGRGSRNEPVDYQR